MAKRERVRVWYVDFSWGQFGGISEVDAVGHGDGWKIFKKPTCGREYGSIVGSVSVYQTRDAAVAYAVTRLRAQAEAADAAAATARKQIVELEGKKEGTND